MRDVNTGSKQFRELAEEVSMLMAFECLRDLPLEEVEVQTPMAKAETRMLYGKKIAVVPILRAGLGMINGILSLVPSAKVGHIGLYRDPETMQPKEYYCKLPENIEKRQILILDPMLATGGSASEAVSLVKARGGKKIKYMCIISAPEGLKKLSNTHTDIDIYCGCLDEKLDEHGYILPGLGDVGDRMFGTR